jgi:hypothetical protein
MLRVGYNEYLTACHSIRSDLLWFLILVSLGARMNTLTRVFESLCKETPAAVAMRIGDLTQYR